MRVGILYQHRTGERCGGDAVWPEDRNRLLPGLEMKTFKYLLSAILYATCCVLVLVTGLLTSALEKIARKE